jgi:hypothetical protein
MPLLENLGCDVAGNTFKTLLKVVDKHDSLLRRTSNIRCDPTLGSSMRSALASSKNVDQVVLRYIS